MPTRKWQASSGASKNRILGATRLKSEGQTIFPVTLNDNSSNGFALNVQGSNLVLGIGTSHPFSRLSMGNTTDSGVFNANDTGRLASLAFNETSSGGKFSGMFYNSSIAKYDQRNDSSNNGIQVKTTSLNNFDIYGSGGNLFLTDENITTIGGFPRKGITELNDTDYKGIEKYTKAGGGLGTDDPDNETLTNKEGQSKIVLDVRGSIRTDGYINFFNTTTTTITDSEGTAQLIENSPSAAWWSNADRNIPRGSVWLQPAGAGRSEGMYYKNASGTTLRIETIATTASDSETSITKGDALKYNLFNFFFNATDQDSQSTVGIGNNDTVVAYPYAILKGGVSGARVQGDPASRVGGTALNIRGKNTNLSDIKHEKGFFVGTNEREIFSITEGNMSVTGLSGEEFLIKQKDAQTSGGPIHPMYSFPTEHGLLSTDASGGKVWIERQLLIGPKKSHLNWGIIDIQSTPNVPTLLSYNLDKDWNYDNETQRINRRYITEKATNAIILLNKSSDTTGDGDDGGSLVGSLYDCSNSIIIGDTFTSIDIPKSLIISVNPTLTTGAIDSDNIDGQQVFDDIGGSIVSGENNWVYKSPYSLVIGKDNFIDNNQPGSYNATGLNSVLGDNNELWTGTTNFVAGSYHKVSGGSNFVGGRQNLIGDFTGKIKSRNATTSPSSSNGSQIHKWNTVFGYYNKIHNVSGVNYSFAAGNANLVDVSRGVALGTHAYAGGDIRFAIGVNDTITTTTATSSSNSNKFVIDKDDNVGIGTSSPKHPLQIGDNNVNMTVQAASGMVINGTLNNSFESDYPSRNVANNGNAPILILAAGTNPSNNLSFGVGGSNYGFRTWIQGYFDNGIGGNGTKDILLQPVGGNVGIGTTSPASALQIDAAIFAMGSTAPTKGIHLGMNSTEANINLCAQGDSYSRIQFSKTSNNYQRGQIQYNHENNRMEFHVNYDREALRLMSNGDIYAPYNVGIGTTTPDYVMDFGNSTNAIKIPKGTSAQRPTPTDGLIRYNDENNEFEGYGNSAWGSLGGVITPSKRTKILADDTNGLEFYTGESSANERMTIDKNGNVGIGTTSPGSNHTAKLEVNGNIKGAKIWTNVIQAYSEGNVGGGAHLYLGGNGGNGSWNNYVFFGSGNAYINSANGDIHTATGIFHKGDYDTNMKFDTNIIRFTTANVERLRIDSAGNVGIGTSSPGAKLEVSTDLNATTDSITTLLNLKQRVSTYHYGPAITFSVSPNGAAYATAAKIVGILDGGYSGHLRFYTKETNGNGGENGLGERMRIDKDGNVGIGVTAPTYPLHVNGNVKAGTFYGSLSGNSTSTSRLAGADDRNNNTSVSSGLTTRLNKWTIDAQGTSSSSFTDIIRMSNWVDSTAGHQTGIGVNKSNVYLRTYRVGNWDNVYNYYVNVDMGSSSSDSRIKKNIKIVPDNVALDLFRKIHAYQYDYINPDDDDDEHMGTSFGYIAQNVREHYEVATRVVTDVIPNEHRIIDNPQWTEIYDNSNNKSFKLTIPDLKEPSGNLLYKFKLFYDVSGNIDDLESLDELPVRNYEIKSLENEPTSFIFDEIETLPKEVYIEGKYIHDYHRVFKKKLHSLHYAASKDIDKIQQEEKTKLAAAEAKIASLETQLAQVLARLDALENN